MNRSFEMHRHFREANDRFDNFVLAALLAVCAYLGQSNPYAPFGLNSETIFFLSLASFVSSAFFGFKRIEYVIVGYRLNHQLLDARENNNPKQANEAISALSKAKVKAERFYKLRNVSMFVGLCFYVTAKYWVVYINA
jgi:hypothetical protein